MGATFTVYLGDQVVARHRRRPKDSFRVTLPEHAEAIRTLARRRGALRAPHRAPRFEQLTASRPISEWMGPIEAPPVQERSLDAYDAVAAS